MAVSRSYCAAFGVSLFNELKMLSIPTQLAVKIRLAIEPYGVDRPGYPATWRLLVDGARDQCRCRTLYCT
jgi:hypothetical protein